MGITKKLWQDPQTMVVSDKPLCLEVRFDVAYDLIMAKGHDAFYEYYINVTTELSKILSWHNIRLDVYDTVLWWIKDEIEIGRTLSETSLRYQEFVYNLNDEADAHVLLVEIDTTEKNLGRAFYDGACSRTSYAVAQGGSRVRWDPQYAARVIAHELGHLLGFDHITESDTTCKCPWDGFKCIMRPETYDWSLPLPTSFDSCSMKKLIQHPKSCLLDCEYERISSYDPICGDNILQQGEQCDCSFEEACIVTGRSKCCDSATCKFKSPSMQCVEGACCQDCKFKRGTLCRPKSDECDLDDYCPGNSRFCDTHYKVSGTKCAGDSAFCFDGICQTKDHWCKRIFPNSEATYSKECADFARSKAATDCSGISSTNLKNMFCGTGKGVCGQVYCSLAKPSDPNYTFTVGSLRCYSLLDDPEDLWKNKVPRGGICEADKICFYGDCIPASSKSYKCSKPCRQYEECDGYYRICVPSDPKWFDVYTGSPE